MPTRGARRQMDVVQFVQLGAPKKREPSQNRDDDSGSGAADAKLKVLRLSVSKRNCFDRDKLYLTNRTLLSKDPRGLP